MDVIRWQQDLEDDKEVLEKLIESAKVVKAHQDLKLKELQLVISHKMKNPINPDNKKIIVFTAFADTAKYLYKHLSQWALDTHGICSALLTGTGDNKTNMSGIRKDFTSILTSFSPISKERFKTHSELQSEIDLLIATDCISEGQNLQDCDYLINYDIHWNPVRIIQRFGRVDRLGSKNTQIHW